jgi:hypothetical protein
MPKMFISYRRDDTSGIAGRLAQELITRFGRANVFIDVDSISPGIDFTQRIDQALDQCQLALILIGNRWLQADAQGHRRIDDRGDYVHREAAAALGHRDVTVIPILVDDARMPSPAELPEDLQALSTIDAFELDNKRWSYDLGLLVDFAARRDPWWKRLARLLPRTPKRIALTGVVLAALVAAVVVLLTSGSAETRQVLSPAATPPVVDECTHSVSVGADGNVGPITCNGGELNVAAWQRLQTSAASNLVMTLGPRALPEDALQAMCTDLRNGSTNVIETSRYKIAELYYGWSFGIDPTSELSSC